MVAYDFVLFSLCDGKRAETDDTVSNTPATLETFAERIACTLWNITFQPAYHFEFWLILSLFIQNLQKGITGWLVMLDMVATTIFGLNHGKPQFLKEVNTHKSLQFFSC
ncbi:unnamed protein product [Lactuca saligna]|uniref:Uncharacterized protein n=1 Tax=Lactuca saligna TaxID=75948 RepID=A0AA35ZIM6_LACSI|nr:unnamed protein product [Lactuca saligna]